MPRTSLNLIDELPGIGDISESDLDEILASVTGSMPNTVSAQEPPSSSQPSGKYRFTADEWDHCWRLVRQLLEADQTIGIHRASDKVHEQVRIVPSRCVTHRQSPLLVTKSQQNIMVQGTFEEEGHVR